MNVVALTVGYLVIAASATVLTGILAAFLYDALSGSDEPFRVDDPWEFWENDVRSVTAYGRRG